MAEERDFGFLSLNHPLHFRSSVKKSNLICLGFLLLFLTWQVLFLTLSSQSCFLSLVTGVYQISLLTGIDELKLVSTGFPTTAFHNTGRADPLLLRQCTQTCILTELVLTDWNKPFPAIYSVL